MAAEHVDVLIVGAGLSGISAAYHLRTRCPAKRYAILEARDAIGGTWDLFRYPGVRSDSDMYTLGYGFRPWHEAKTFADGPSIRRYIRETARAYGIDRAIRFGHRVRRAAWSSATGRWAVEAERGPDKELVRLSCGFLFMCSGYYDYGEGYSPTWPGVERFRGRVVHPQHWPEDLDYAGRRVVVIGSGATAVTLVPELAKRAAHVTMLQRSPTYVVALPSEDRAVSWLRRRVPPPVAYRLARWKSIGMGMLSYALARRWPGATRRAILNQARAQLGPQYDVEAHFAPSYNPWDQRVCVAPDGDLFRAIKAGRASVVTDGVEGLSETGVRLRSGQELAADIVVTATGLNLRLMGGAQLVVDDAPVDLGKTLTYKGTMYSGVPNLASAFGYTNASWTLKCELIAAYVCRLLTYMDRHGYTQCTPRRPRGRVVEAPALGLTSGYVRRALHALPRQGPRGPWRMYQNYIRDLLSLRLSLVSDGALEFARPVEQPTGVARGEPAR
ncbi:MAG: hypothetical protein RLZZ387_4194 [Chloroflexota bacterium]|jgi:cation diffusion facilitator CzcD-associated flavoprotein CzcO